MRETTVYANGNVKNAEIVSSPARLRFGEMSRYALLFLTTKLPTAVTRERFAEARTRFVCANTEKRKQLRPLARERILR